jgi:large subunit ribosomal protein L28
MARICKLTGLRPIRGNRIHRSGKSKRSGGIGTHVTAITKRWFYPNIKRVRAVINGRVVRIRVSTRAIKSGLIVKPMKRVWKNPRPPKPAA